VPYLHLGYFGLLLVTLPRLVSQPLPARVGNPFYLQQLTRLPGRAGGAAPAVAEVPLVIEVPPTVAAALTEELAVLSGTARLVLEGAAVAGGPFEPELAAAAAAIAEDLSTPVSKTIASSTCAGQEAGCELSLSAVVVLLVQGVILCLPPRPPGPTWALTGWCSSG
jgi:hypothetical protein